MAKPTLQDYLTKRQKTPMESAIATVVPSDVSLEALVARPLNTDYPDIESFIFAHKNCSAPLLSINLEYWSEKTSVMKLAQMLSAYHQRPIQSLRGARYYPANTPERLERLNKMSKKLVSRSYWEYMKHETKKAMKIFWDAKDHYLSIKTSKTKRISIPHLAMPRKPTAESLAKQHELRKDKHLHAFNLALQYVQVLYGQRIPISYASLMDAGLGPHFVLHSPVGKQTLSTALLSGYGKGLRHEIMIDKEILNADEDRIEIYPTSYFPLPHMVRYVQCMEGQMSVTQKAA